MRARLGVVIALFAMLGLPLPASADHGNADQASPNMFHLAQVQRGGTNSDLAFWNNLAAAGNYSGTRLLDIRDPDSPVVLSTITCRGPQGDVSFYKAKQRLLLFVSVDTPQTVPGPPPGSKDCQSSDSTEALGFEGVRIWDVTDPRNPKFVKLVRTDCGSHTHTTIPDKDDQRALIYVSSYPLAATGIGPNCGELNPVNGKPHGKISIVQVPDADPAAAEVLKEQPLHHDTDAAGTPPEGGDDDLPAAGAVGCHDITAFFEANQGPESNPHPRKQLAAAACLTEGQIWDISDPENPKTLEEDGHSHIRNESIEFWHSSSFTWDGETILFGDEHGGGSAPGCAGSADPTGNMWFYRTVPPPDEPPLLGRYHTPRQQLVPPQECSIHNFNVVPLNDNKAYIGVSSAYRAGTTVVDFTEAQEAEPYTGLTALAPIIGEEIGFYDALVGGEADTWSTYWYNDYIWANDGLSRTATPSRGLDVFKILVPDENGKQLRARKFHHLNPQTQEVFGAQGG